MSRRLFEGQPFVNAMMPCVHCGHFLWVHFPETPTTTAFIACSTCGYREPAVQIGTVVKYHGDGMVTVELCLPPPAADEPLTVEAR